LNREEAIPIILRCDIRGLSKEEREIMLLNCWGVDADDPELSQFSESLQEELLQLEEPTEDAMDERYEPLLISSIKGSYFGEKNEYLSELISKILYEKVLVEGEPEKLFACPCCEYETLKERGGYDICPVCFWEDDGNNESSRYSGPNHMTLAEGIANFDKYGAITKESVRYVSVNAKERYYKSGNAS
jgi:hypothetical protein